MLKITNNTCLTALILILVNLLGSTGFASAPRSGVSAEQVVRDASKLARMNADWFLLQGSGKSMNPYFADNSILLLEKAPLSSLRKGMIVAFRDEEGDTVAHHVVSNDNGVVITRGYNNMVDDPTALTSDALMGVVFGILNAQDPIPAGTYPVALGKTR